MEEVDMEDAVIEQFRDWVKGDIWGIPGESFYQCLKRVMDQVNSPVVDGDCFADGIWALVDELQPSADRESVAATIDLCIERIGVLNAFFDANDVHGLKAP